MMKNGVYVFDRDCLSNNHTFCKQTCEGALALGADCVVSNTFTQYWEIVDYISLAQRYEVDYQIITKKATVEETPDHDVPREIVKKMALRWERIDGELVIGSHRTMDFHMLRLVERYQPERFERINKRGLLVERSV